MDGSGLDWTDDFQKLRIRTGSD